MALKEDLIRALAAALAAHTGLHMDQAAQLLTEPKNRAFGDVAFPCFPLAKTWKKAPPACALELQSVLELPAGFSGSEAVGPYLNFRFDRPKFISSALKAGLPGVEPRKMPTVVVEYSSPNIAKPFHVGHLRATLIGNCLDRVYRRLGWNAVSINHLGDWGTQFGFVWAGCKLWGYPEDPSVQSLVELYRRATALKEEHEKNPPQDGSNVNEIARCFFVDLEKGEQYAVDFWRSCVDISLDYLEKTYARLDVRFDHYIGESFYSDKLDGVKQALSEAGLLVESQGALGVDLGQELGFARIYTPDGRSLYLTRDIATALYRAEKFRFDKALYVVGAPQMLHFQQLQAVLQALGKDFADNIVHVAFGHVLGMKTRGGGDFIELNEFLDEAYDRALEAYRTQVTKRPEGLDEEEVARAVALAAILFSNLNRSNIKDVHFKWEHALEFQGDSGPYLLYACARINGIKDKAAAEGLHVDSHADVSLLTEDSAYELASLLADFESVLVKTAAENEPAVLANYALEVAKSFSQAYLELKVLGEAEAKARARLVLFEATHRVLAEALRLLGIGVLARM